jgi:hypothetical protein
LILCSSVVSGSLLSEHFSDTEEFWFAALLRPGPPVVGRGGSAADVLLSPLASVAA